MSYTLTETTTRNNSNVRANIGTVEVELQPDLVFTSVQLEALSCIPGLEERVELLISEGKKFARNRTANAASRRMRMSGGSAGAAAAADPDPDASWQAAIDLGMSIGETRAEVESYFDAVIKYLQDIIAVCFSTADPVAPVEPAASASAAAKAAFVAQQAEFASAKLRMRVERQARDEIQKIIAALRTSRGTLNDNGADNRRKKAQCARALTGVQKKVEIEDVGERVDQLAALFRELGLDTVTALRAAAITVAPVAPSGGGGASAAPPSSAAPLTSAAPPSPPAASSAAPNSTATSTPPVVVAKAPSSGSGPGGGAEFVPARPPTLAPPGGLSVALTTGAALPTSSVTMAALEAVAPTAGWGLGGAVGGAAVYGAGTYVACALSGTCAAITVGGVAVAATPALAAGAAIGVGAKLIANDRLYMRTAGRAVGRGVYNASAWVYGACARASVQRTVAALTAAAAAMDAAEANQKNLVREAANVRAPAGNVANAQRGVAQARSVYQQALPAVNRLLPENKDEARLKILRTATAAIVQENTKLQALIARTRALAKAAANAQNAAARGQLSSLLAPKSAPAPAPSSVAPSFNANALMRQRMSRAASRPRAAPVQASAPAPQPSAAPAAAAINLDNLTTKAHFAALAEAIVGGDALVEYLNTMSWKGLSAAAREAQAVLVRQWIAANLAGRYTQPQVNRAARGGARRRTVRRSNRRTTRRLGTSANRRTSRN